MDDEMNGKGEDVKETEDMEVEESCSDSEGETEESGSSDEESGASGDEEEGSGSDWETDGEGSSGEEEEETGGANGKQGTSNSQSSADALISESDGESEKCAICLARIADQEIGTPEGCDHDFCLECIQEWSKNVNTCPVDRQVFHLILAKHSAEGTVYKKIPIKDTQLEVEDEGLVGAEDMTACEVCGESNREDRLLLCDGCDLAYHCECLPTPLAAVPRGMWFCPDCAPRHQRANRRAPAAETTPNAVAAVPEEEGLDADVIIDGPRNRYIGRTLVSERVRAVIAEAREERARARQQYRRRVYDDSDDDGDFGAEDELHSVAEPKPRTPRKATSKKRKTPRKRKTKRKTTKKRKTKPKTTTTSGGTTTTKRKRKRKRKTKRKSTKKARTKSATPKTAKTRIADRLGIKKPGAGRSIPTVREAHRRSLDDMRSSIGISGLSILGTRDDLDPFLHASDDEFEERGRGGGGGGVAVARAPVPRFGPHITKAALASRLPIKGAGASRPRIRPPAPPRNCGGSFDLLGDIMQGQNLLNTSADKIIIKRDGSLTTSNPSSPSKKARHHGLVKNPSFSAATSEPKDGDDSNKSGGDSSSTGQNSNTQGSSEGSREGQMEVTERSDEGQGQGSSSSGSGGGMGEDNDDHLFNPGDLCIDSSADDKSQEGEDKDKEKEEKEKEKEKEKDSKSEDVYDPEHATTSDDEEEQQKQKEEEEKKEELYDPMEATAGSEPQSPSGEDSKPRSTGDELYDPMDVTKSDDEEDEKEGEKSELYDPLQVTESDVEEKSEQVEKDTEDKGTSGGEKIIEVTPDVDNEMDTNSNDKVDEETSNVVAAISDILKSKEGEGEESETKDSTSPFKSYDTTESPVSVLKEQSENAQMPESVNPEAPVQPVEVVPEVDSDCPTPVADENGPESPDPETQNPANFAFSHSVAGGNGEDSNVTSPAATPSAQNDVTPNLSPISNSEIPLAKHGAQTPEHDTTSKASFPPDADGWEVKSDERGLTDSEEEEFQRRFMPVADLPRIPKKKQPPPEVIVIEDEDSPEDAHKSVLEKVNVKEDSYRWEGKGRRDRSRERKRRSRSRSGSRTSRHRHRHREDSSDDGRRERKKKHKRRSRSRSRDRSRRSRSKERRRARRGHSRSRERKRSLSREPERERERERKRRSRSRTPKRKEKRKDRERERSREKVKKRDRDRDRERRSPSRDRFGRSVPSEYKASIKTFSKAIKDAATPDAGRKFKLKRNFYNEVIDGENSDSDVPLPSEPPKKKEDKSKKDRNRDRDRDRDREDRGGWRTPSPAPEQKIETVISSRPKQPSYERNDAYPSDSDSSGFTSEEEDKIVSKKTNNIAIRTEEPKQKSPPRLYSNYDPSDPTEEAVTPPIPDEDKPKTPPPIPGLGSPNRTGPPPPRHQDPAASMLFTGSPLSLDPLRNPTSTIDMIREPPPGFLNPENPIRPQGPGMMLRTPLGIVQHPGGQVMVNPLLPPPPFTGQFPGGPPSQFTQAPPSQGGRLQSPGFIQLASGQRVPVSQNGLPIPQLEGLPPGMRPVLPDTRLPPPSTTASAQPGLPAKALEQMQQISNLLNAQAKLAQFVPGKQGGGKDGNGEQAPPASGLLGAPPPGLKPIAEPANKFKVPLPPPPINNKDSSSEGKKKKAEETTEVVDMDVASPYSDDEVGINISFSPPLKKRSRRDRESEKEKKKPTQQSNSSDMESKLNEVFGKQQKPSNNSTPTKKKKEKVGNVKFNLEKKPSALVKPSKAAPKPAGGGDDGVPTSAVELDKQQKFLKKMNRQERVVEEVKLAIKPHYAAGKISKLEYKEIMRKAVPKICHSKSGDINPEKIRNYVQAYVTKTRQLKKYEQKKVVVKPAAKTGQSKPKK